MKAINHRLTIVLFIFLLSCTNETNQKVRDEVNSIPNGSALSASVKSDMIDKRENKLLKSIDIFKSRGNLNYYKDFSFFGVDDAKTRLIFENIDKIEDLEFVKAKEMGPLGLSPITNSDVSLEKMLLDSIKLSNEELIYGIKKVLSKIQNQESYFGLITQSDRNDFKEYYTTISYDISLENHFLILKTTVIIDNPNKNIAYITESIEKSDITKLSFEKWSTQAWDGVTRQHCPIKSLLPALKNNRKLNYYFIQGSIGLVDWSSYPGYQKEMKYYTYDKTTNSKVENYKERFIGDTSKKTGDPLDDLLHEMNVNSHLTDNIRFYSKEGFDGLLDYLAMLFMQLRKNKI